MVHIDAVWLNKWLKEGEEGGIPRSVLYNVVTGYTQRSEPVRAMPNKPLALDDLGLIVAVRVKWLFDNDVRYKEIKHVIWNPEDALPFSDDDYLPDMLVASKAARDRLVDGLRAGGTDECAAAMGDWADIWTRKIPVTAQREGATRSCGALRVDRDEGGFFYQITDMVDRVVHPDRKRRRRRPSNGSLPMTDSIEGMC